MSCAFDDGNDDFEVVVASSGKQSSLSIAFPRLIMSGHRMMVFSQFCRVLRYGVELLRMLSINFAPLDGATNTEDRLTLLREFNINCYDIPVFLLTV